MSENALGALVPSVKPDSLMPSISSSTGLVIEVGPEAAPPDQPPEPSHPAEEGGEATEQGGGDVGVLDKEFQCPICMQIMKDAFLTACGHSYCYMCIATHLRNKNDCPRCGRFLSNSLIFPNFALDKLVKKMSSQLGRNSTPFECLRKALTQGCEVSIKELNSLLSLLAEKKRKMEQDESEANMQILLEFLYCLRKQKLEELNEIKNHLRYIKEDIKAVERRRVDLYCTKGRHSTRLRMVAHDSATAIVCSRNTFSSIPSVSGMQDDVNDPVNCQRLLRDAAFSCTELEHPAQAGLNTARKRRIHMQFNELQECYLQKRHLAKQSCREEDGDLNIVSKIGYHPGLEDFQSVLSTFTRYSRLKVIAELRHGDIFHSVNIISSIEFDRDDELFAIAGVSRRIKVFEFSTVVNEATAVHCPIVEMATRSKLSCLSWNKCTKNHIASSDYEGIVTVWDVLTCQSIMEYEEHEKRAWSVDFSRNEPSMLVSGSDDCKVKIWCTKQEESVINIDLKANICSVKFNPGSSIHVAVGSADHDIHYYDLRNISQPVHVFTGHKKAVSYVKFMSNNELASASTDSTLRLWDVKENLPIRTYKGHMNEKNFVGFTVNRDYIACGSETNDVFVYHKAIPRPAARHKIISSEFGEAEEDIRSCFISAVSWKSDSPTMIAANSQGTIKVLALSA
ncbi:coatomer subunit alpha, variant 2 [Ancistrocladus abbreviatus]